jgi:hypothetical protein
MMGGITAPAAMPAALLARLPDGGVLLRPDTGEYFRLDPLAAEVAAAWIAGADPLAVLVHAGATREQASDDLRRLSAIFDSHTARRRNPVHSRPEHGGHLLCWQGAPFAWVAPGEIEHRGLLERDHAVRLAVPHALALLGVRLVHGSAVAEGARARLFVGPSGAGKTTLARRSGRPVVAEDLILIEDSDRGLEVIDGAERAIHGWIHRGGRRFDSADLADLRSGSRLPIAALHLIDAGRRGPLAHQRLGPADGLIELLGNAFAELATPQVDRFALDVNADLARRAPIWRTTIPHGLAEVTEALASTEGWPGA